MDDRARFDEFARLATEQRNPRTADLDTLDATAILERINAEDRTVPDAVAHEIPYIAHVPLEPRTAVAEWTNGKVTVWTGTQRPFGVRTEVASAFSIP